jgi:hypothetical protein
MAPSDDTAAAVFWDDLKKRSSLYRDNRWVNIMLMVCSAILVMCTFLYMVTLMVALKTKKNEKKV